MGKLTTRYINAIPASHNGSRIHWDDTLKGFGVRVSAGGAKTFIVSYRTLSGRRRSMSLGSCEIIPAARARRRAREILADAALGGDPAGELKRLREEPTFEHLALEYIDRHASGKRSATEDIRIIRKDLLRALGHLRINEIERRDIIVLVNAVMDRGAPIMANRTLALLRKMFNFAIEQAFTESNPCSRIRRPGKEKRRDRVLSEGEITSFWHNLPQSRISEPVRDILKLILITAQRPGEVAGSAWVEFDHAAAQSLSTMEPNSNTPWWTIPAQRSKNGLAHRVPLSRPALQIIASRPNDGLYLFPSPKDGTKHIRISSLSHAMRNNIDMLGVEPFTPHDLRRTAASQMAGMGISRLVIARILNHAESGVTAIYDRHSYDNEKREALDAWAERIGEIIGKRNST